MTKFDWLIFAISMVVLILLEFALRALVGDRWPWFMIAVVMAAQVTRQGLGSDK